jgi:hypothetical protein
LIDDTARFADIEVTVSPEATKYDVTFVKEEDTSP